MTSAPYLGGRCNKLGRLGLSCHDRSPRDRGRKEQGRELQVHFPLGQAPRRGPRSVLPFWGVSLCCQGRARPGLQGPLRPAE